jgi:hypothetical protein
VQAALRGGSASRTDRQERLVAPKGKEKRKKKCVKNAISFKLHLRSASARRAILCTITLIN